MRWLLASITSSRFTFMHDVCTMYVCNVLRYRKYVRLANVPCTGSLINYITVVLSCLGTFECAR